LWPFLRVLFPQSSITASTTITRAYGELPHRAKIPLLDLLLIAIIRLQIGSYAVARARSAAQDRQLPRWNLSRLLPQLSDHLTCRSRYSVSSILRERVPRVLLIAINEPISTPLSTISRALCLLDAFCPLFSSANCRYWSVPELSNHCLDSSPNSPLSRGLLTSQIECRLDFEGGFQT
jgi:hypothetical protein